MSGVNKVILVGQLGADPETRQTCSGKSETNIRLATSDAWKDKQTGEPQERTEWHSVVFFDRLAEIASQYLRKGSMAYVEGRLQTEMYTDKQGIQRWATEIRADVLQLLGSKNDSTEQDLDVGTAAYAAKIAILAEGCEERHELYDIEGEMDRGALATWRSLYGNKEREALARERFQNIKSDLDAQHENERMCTARAEEARFFQIRSLLRLPKGQVERQCLLNSIAASKQDVVAEMVSWENYGASNYTRESERDSSVPECEFYGDYDQSRGEFDSLLTLERNVRSAFAYEDSKYSRSAEIKLSARETGVAAGYIYFIRRLLQNNLDLMEFGEAQLKDAHDYLARAIEECEKCGPDPSDDQDEANYWYEKDDERIAAELYLESLAATVPVAWPLICELSHIPEIGAIVMSHIPRCEMVARLRDLCMGPIGSDEPESCRKDILSCNGSADGATGLAGEEKASDESSWHRYTVMKYHRKTNISKVFYDYDRDKLAKEARRYFRGAIVSIELTYAGGKEAIFEAYPEHAIALTIRNHALSGEEFRSKIRRFARKLRSMDYKIRA